MSKKRTKVQAQEHTSAPVQEKADLLAKFNDGHYVVKNSAEKAEVIAELQERGIAYSVCDMPVVENGKLVRFDTTVIIDRR